MRVVAKEILDYEALASEICNMAALGDTECSLMLIAAKVDIERTYGRQCANYSALVSSFEDGPQEYMIVPHKCFTGIADYAAFFAEGYADVYWSDPVLLLYLVVLIVGLVTIGVIRALTM